MYVQYHSTILHRVAATILNAALNIQYKTGELKKKKNPCNAKHFSTIYLRKGNLIDHHAKRCKQIYRLGRKFADDGCL